MTWFTRMPRTLQLLFAVLGLSVAPALANNSPHESCGVLVQSGSCVLLQSDNGNTYYYAGGFAPFSPGDYVHVVGEEGPCIQSCGSGLGCLFGLTVIESCLSDPSTAYCFGDGSGTACPCGNNGAAGEGCANSSGAGASLTVSGSGSVSADDLGFSASGLLAAQPALLFSADNSVAGGAGTIFGDGLRCAGGNVKRLGVVQPDANGDASWSSGMAQAGGWSSGDTRRMQVWYRDPAGGPCASGFNLTHAREVVFTP